MLSISNNLSIPEEEFTFTFSRSSGPGGQNVNKVNSKATLHWGIRDSPSLPAAVRHRFTTAFKNRITTEGIFVLSSQRYRDQPKNIADCLEKLAEMVRSVLHPPKPRRATKPTRGSRERRLEAKRQRSAKKNTRRSSDFRE
jgi:ribosome-associated protein